MATVFKDASGREWDCTITGGSVRRVENACGINLADVIEGDPSPLTVLTSPAGYSKWLTVLYHVLRPQAETRSITQDAFDELISGTVAASAFDAFWGAMQLFFQSRGLAAQADVIPKQLALLMAKYEALREATAGIDLNLLKQLTVAAATERGKVAMDKLRALLPGNSSGSSPESSASTQTSEPSASLSG